MRWKLLAIGALITAACGGSPPAGSTPPSTTTPQGAAPHGAAPQGAAPHGAATPGASDIVDTFDDLRPRLHAIYRGRLDYELETYGQYCASELVGVEPPGARGPARLCTPVDQVIGWHAPNPMGKLPVGSPRWIATTRDDAGHERIAAVTVADRSGSALTDEARQFLTQQYGCGQLELAWRIPVASQACERDADCRLFGSNCFSAAVATRHAAPYEELYRRWGGTCDDPTGGQCPPAGSVACVERRCTVMH